MTPSPNRPHPIAWLYLALAIAGAVVPWYFNLQAILHSSTPPTFMAYWNAGFANALSGSLTSDLLIGATAGTWFVVHESKRLGMRHAWAWVLLTCLVAFACALPLFLFVRELRRAETPG